MKKKTKLKISVLAIGLVMFFLTFASNNYGKTLDVVNLNPLNLLLYLVSFVLIGIGIYTLIKR
jgi:hypothetical protein